MKKGNYKSLFVLMVCAILVGGLTGCSSNPKGNEKPTNKPSAKVEEKVEVGEKQIPENYLKDIETDYKASLKADNKNLKKAHFNSMLNMNSFRIKNSMDFHFDNIEKNESHQGDYLYFRGENAKKFIIDNFKNFGYTEDYINQKVLDVNLTIDDLCFFLLRTNSMLDDRSQEIFKDGEFKDLYMIGFLTDDGNTLTLEDMTTHETNMFISTAKAYK